MKIIFFGLGSIGKRHAKILKDNFSHELFAYRAVKGKGANNLNIKEIHTWDEVKNINPDAAFITNPTFLHIETALKCAKLNIKLFIEKPIDCSAKKMDLLIKEVRKRKIASYVAYNLRFHPVINFLKRYLKSKQIYHAAIYNASYLPDWKPDTDYRESYSVSARKGGGVILDLSHEFDYSEYLFGNIMDIKGVFGKVSGITKDSEDFMDAVLKTEKVYVNLHLDFLSLCPERTIKIDCKNEFIVADLINSSIKFIKGKNVFMKRFNDGVKETYKKQLNYFFDNINNCGMMNNLPEAGILFRKILKFKKRKA